MSSSASKMSAADDIKVINEEYKIWKKNTPFLYDIVCTHALEWPSLTVQWLNDKLIDEPASADDVDNTDMFTVHRLLLGTHTSDGEPNYLYVAELRLPNTAKPITAGYDNGQFGRLDIVQTINHTSEVHRARANTFNSSLVATKTDNADVCIFDRSRHPLKAARHAPARPEMTLTGHTAAGFGLNWSPTRNGYLISGSEDGLVCVWDTNSGAAPIRTLRSHTDTVEDVAFHPTKPDECASAGDDKRLIIWDTRAGRDAPASSVIAHTAEVNSVAYNPLKPQLILTGSADHTCALFDTRKLDTKLHSFESHTNHVFTVAWSPLNECIFASGGADRRCMVWDVSRIGREQDADEAEDGPSELLFVHGGHTDKIAELSWAVGGNAANDPAGDLGWTIASVADDNVCQIWKMANQLYEDDDDEDKERKLDDRRMIE